MYQNANVRHILAVLSSLAITTVIGDDWPKRGLAANEDVPIWQVSIQSFQIQQVFSDKHRRIPATVP